ncbi:hypothetical protein NDU88_010912 [Pleurodeles waltl]|uniref:Uncharacterized protein n=1 Tax=Pleurodeles waltl TaxID=8319 RepID=A0AAV7QXB6_PLEWA|nr:hypothetical protein NDU88_010912 [Pleurodeles waltl]
MSEIPGDYKVGDWVRVVKGAWPAKGESKFSEPLEVRKVYRYAMLLSDGNVWNRGKVIRVPVGGNREKLTDMGNKLGNNVDDNTSTSETPLSKREHECVKGVCSIQLIPFRAPYKRDSSVSTRGAESKEKENGERRRQQRLRCLPPGFQEYDTFIKEAHSRTHRLGLVSFRNLKIISRSETAHVTYLKMMDLRGRFTAPRATRINREVLQM